MEAYGRLLLLYVDETRISGADAIRYLNWPCGGPQENDLTPEAGGRHSHNLWAPEIHYVDNKWYIYFTANDGEATSRAKYACWRTGSLIRWKASGNGKVRATPVPGLDGTVMSIGDQLYFLYAGYGHFPDYGSAIYIMRMTNPWTLTGDHVLLTAPTLSWENKAEWH